MIETLVSLALIGLVMASMTVFFTRSMRFTHQQGQTQSAVAVATDAMEQARALSPIALPSGRDARSVEEQWAAATEEVAPYLSVMEHVVDEDAATGAGARAPLPTVGQTVPVDGIDFTRTWYLGRCWLNSGSPDCVAANRAAPNAVGMFGVVVAVSWPTNDCPGNVCVVVTSMLVPARVDEPVFVVPTLSPPAPVAPATTSTPTPTATSTPTPGPVPALIWANRMTNGASPAALSVTTTGIMMNGLIHSNSDIAFNADGGMYGPRVEYGTTLTKTLPNVVSGAVKVAPSVPEHRVLADYRPGGSEAVAAGAGYRQATCSSGKWTASAAAVSGASVIYVPCNAIISSSVNVLVVAEGTITVSGNPVVGSDNAEHGLVSNSNSASAITINGDTYIHGSVQALQGRVTISSTAAWLFCGIIGDTISLGGTGVIVDVAPDCAAS
jgi:type II secretory pathway pseudopilin PulG